MIDTDLLACLLGVVVCAVLILSHGPCVAPRWRHSMTTRPSTWQDEQAAVEAAFERSGVARTWPGDEPDQMVPMVNAMADEIASLRLAIRRLAEQDATLSMQGGNVTVTTDATLTDAEREAVECTVSGHLRGEHISTLCRLLERTK